METKDQIEDIVVDFLQKLEVSAQVSVLSDESGAYRVNIQTDETGLLIGFHGKTLESLQILLNLVIAKKLEKWERVYVNVGDYREKREEALMYMAQHAAERALAMGRPVELSNLSAAERRVIHLTLSGDERVMTESEGEGRNRRLLIKPKL